MITPRHALHVLFLLPLVAQAQEPHSTIANLPPYFGPAIFENPQDSADFTQFVNGLRRVDPTLPPDIATFQYRLVWRVVERGGITVASRGNGSVMRSAERLAFDPHPPYTLMSLPYRTADGRRILVLAHEVPCGLICRNTECYVEE